MLHHVNSKRCLTLDDYDKNVYAGPCDTNSKGQKWLIQNTDDEALEKWDQA